MDIEKLIAYIESKIYENHKQELTAEMVKDAVVMTAREIGVAHEDVMAVIRENSDDLSETLKLYLTRADAKDLLDKKLDVELYEADKEVSSKEKQELDVKLAQTKQELDSVKNSLSHMGNGVVGEAKGDSVISLPSNAMSSVAPNYRIEGLTVQNLIKNGDFSDGNKYWTTQNQNVESVENNILTTTVKELSPYTRLETKEPELEKIIIGSKVYCRLYVKAKVDVGKFQVGGSGFAASSIKEGHLSLTSGITETTESSNIFRYYHSSSSGYEIGDELQYSNIMIVDLTQMFGAGNEPSKEWCDEYLPDYIEGTKSVQLPMRIKSVGENLSNNILSPNSVDIETGEIKNFTNYSYRVHKKPILIKAGNSVFIRKFGGDGKGIMIFNYDLKMNFIGAISSSNSEVLKSKTYNHNFYIIPILINCSKDEVYKMNVSKIDFKYPLSYKESLAYFNDEVELRSVTNTKDYIENGKLYKNISDDGEILEKTEVVNLSTSGLIEANPNGTVFFEPITNITGFYDNGLDVEGLDILEVEEFSHLIDGVYQSLDVSKVKVEGGKLTHPDAKNGIVYLVYRYDNNAVWGENTISYYNSDKTLKSPNGKIWKKVEAATDTGELVVTLEEVKE